MNIHLNGQHQNLLVCFFGYLHISVNLPLACHCGLVFCGVFQSCKKLNKKCYSLALGRDKTFSNHTVSFTLHLACPSGHTYSFLLSTVDYKHISAKTILISQISASYTLAVHRKISGVWCFSSPLVVKVDTGTPRHSKTSEQATLWLASTLLIKYNFWLAKRSLCFILVSDMVVTSTMKWIHHFVKH